MSAIEPSPFLNKNLTIGIIGAGAAGLSTWHYLKQKGYSHITVLEKEQELGGMCRTMEHDGRHYDLGANYITPYYKTVRKIASDLGLKLRPAPQRRSFDLATGNFMKTLDTTLRGVSLLDFGAANLRYLWQVWKYRKTIAAPGLMALENQPELRHPFGKWLDINGMSALRQLFLIPITIFGYGDLDEIPTPYVLKYMNLSNFLVLMLVGSGLSKRWPKHFEQGYQHFFKTLTRGADIRCGVTIQSVRRGADGAHVTLADGTRLHFDRLILACPLDQALTFLTDASAQERELFSHIRYREYYVTACEAKNMLNITTDELQLPPLAPLPPAGHPWGVVKFWPESDINLYFSVGGEGVTPERVHQHIAEDTDRMGGDVVQTIRQQKWPHFFPHVRTASLEAGFYRRMEALQGQAHTYYASGLLAFELIEPIFHYSENLVNTHFSPAKL